MKWWLLTIVLLAGCVGETIEQGDLVYARYEVSYENGTMIDSNIDGEPLLVDVGQGAMIRGFENALIGMREGQTKTVTLSAKDAYGTYDADKTRQVPKILEYNRFIAIPRTQIMSYQNVAKYAEKIELGEYFSTDNYRMSIKQIKGAEVTVYLVAHEQRPTQLAQFPWAASWVDGNTEQYRYELLARVNDTIQTKDGPYTVTKITSDKIFLESHLQQGMTLASELGQGRVSRESDNYYFVDFNHPLAGFNLVFTITPEVIDDRGN